MNKNQNTLAITLSTAVPVWIMSLQDKGGPTKKDFDELKETSKLLGEKGDILLFGGGKKGECANIFNKTAKAIAVLSFLPGGIEIFGMRFETKNAK